MVVAAELSAVAATTVVELSSPTSRGGGCKGVQPAVYKKTARQNKGETKQDLRPQEKLRSVVSAHDGANIKMHRTNFNYSYLSNIVRKADNSWATLIEMHLSLV